MKTWNVSLTTRRGTHSAISIAGYIGDEPPGAGQEIDIGGDMAVVTEIVEGADGQPVICAERTVE